MNLRLRTSLMIAALGAAFAQSAFAQIVINEVVYDNIGSDVACWLELKGPGGMSLNGIEVVGINGAGGGAYQPINLNGRVIPADGYFVIAQSNVVPNFDLISTNVNYQNGPDNILVRFIGGSVIDALGYGTFGGGDVFAGEGSPHPGQSNDISLARCPDGNDTNDNSVDFVLDTTPTPGVPNDAPCTPPDPTPRTLCEVASDAADGTPQLLNEYVLVSGIVISPDGTFSTTATDIKITDGQCCITVFGGTPTTIQIGDEVEVRGTVAFFNGLTEISNPLLQITVVSNGNPVPDPVLVSTAEFSANGENYESCLVGLECVSLTGGTWPPSGTDANLTVDDGSGPATLRIDRDTDIDGSPAPTGEFSVTGVGGQFDTSTPWLHDYQLLPRSLSDFNFTPGCTDNQCADCGPGPHWIHNPACPPGIDNMPSSALVGIDTNLDCVRDMNLVLTGPVRVRRGNPLDDSNHYPGTRPVDGHIDVIDTEMLSMSLTGGGAVLTGGAGMGAIPLAPSFGTAAEQPGDPNLADSFFDVFFEVDLGGGNRLYNQTPLRLDTVIDCVPPHATFNTPNVCIPLFTSPNPGQGVHVANLISTRHTPFPQPGACCLGEVCQLLTADECDGQGGTFLGEGTSCTPNPCASPEPCAECGPGPHWIHTPNCPAGLDNMPSGALVGIDTNLDCVRDVNLVMNGPVQVQRTNPLDDSSNYPGTRPIDGHRDVIDTEILSMSLTGSGAILTAGAGMGSIPLGATKGTIAEQPTNPNLADSFFDVFFEVDLGGGNRLYNQSPVRINSIIDCIPPHAVYLHPNVCIPLYTSPNPGQGVHVANLVTANHTPFPRPGACCFDDVCQQLTANDCQANGGAFLGEDSVCSPNPCPIAGGACCINRTCVVLTQAQCAAQGGSFVANGVGCAPDPCHQSSGIEDEIGTTLPAAHLLDNIPNPVHSQTTIRFYTPTTSDVVIDIYDAGGRNVRTLASKGAGAGAQGIIWDGRDRQGRPVPTGIYAYTLRLGSTELNGKLTVIR